MDDLISRQAAISEIRQVVDAYRVTLASATLNHAERECVQNRKAQAVEDIIALECLPPAREWISCSEKLPKDDEEVLVYLYDRPSPYIAWRNDSHWYTNDFEVDTDGEPSAWMPLPERYQESDINEGNRTDRTTSRYA